jgi:hypothetical protein
LHFSIAQGAADQRAVVGSLQTDDVLAWEDAVSSFVLTCPTAPAAEAIAPVDDLLKAYYAFAEPSMLVVFVDVTKQSLLRSF